MPPRTVSRDLKARIPVLYYEQHYTVKEICDLLGIKKSLVYKTLDFYRTYGIAYNPHAHQSGRRRSLAITDMAFIYNLLEQRHCSYLDEIQTELFTRRGVWCSTPTLLRTLRHLHFSRKCVTAKAIERNDLLRSDFMLRVGREIPDPSMLMFIDEAVKNERTGGRTRGWSLKGRRCIQRRVFVRGQRWSILPILTLNGIITYDIIPGSVTLKCFHQFLHDHVVRYCGLPCV
jgi:transposase